MYCRQVVVLTGNGTEVNAKRVDTCICGIHKREKSGRGLYWSTCNTSHKNVGSQRASRECDIVHEGSLRMTRWHVALVPLDLGPRSVCLRLAHPRSMNPERSRPPPSIERYPRCSDGCQAGVPDTVQASSTGSLKGILR